MIPESEISIESMRASGPGGQGVNTTDSAVRVRWHVEGSNEFSDIQKTRILERLKNRINQEGELYITASTERSQKQNRDDAIARLNELVEETLKEEIPRVTKVPRRVKRKVDRVRLDQKTRVKRKKQNRREPEE